MRLSGCAGQSGSLTEASQGDCSSEEVVSNGLVPDGSEPFESCGPGESDASEYGVCIPFKPCGPKSRYQGALEAGLLMMGLPAC